MSGELQAGDGAVLALHGEIDGNAGNVELALGADAPLESFVLRDPNGLVIQ